MNDWRKPCEHGEYFPHSIEVPCPGHFAFNFEGEAVPISCTVLHYVLCEGGSPVTTADLEGEKVWWCLGFALEDEGCTSEPENKRSYPHDSCGWRLLIPIPDPVAAE